MGRIKKVNAIKPGQLQSGLLRFTFIADADVVFKIKCLAKKENLSVKDLMNRILAGYIAKVKKADSVKQSDKASGNKTISLKNQGKLKIYLNKGKSPDVRDK